MKQHHVLVIDGSYRDDGITDQAVDVVAEDLRAAGAAVEIVYLRDTPIEFCLNCRECCQTPGATIGQCVIDDGMAGLIERIEKADALVLAAPTNLGSVTALFKRFMERLMPYMYWPWGKPWPVPRRPGSSVKKALLISSSAAPGWIGRFLYASPRQLGSAAKTLGAETVGTLFTGQISMTPDKRFPDAAAARARRLARKLLAA